MILFIKLLPILFVIISCVGFLIIATTLFVRYRNHFHKENIVEPCLSITDINQEQVDDLNKDLKPFGFAYSQSQDVFYSLMDGWQRKFGYCQLYDEAAALFSMIIDCEPIPFEYKGVNYLIEFWKGQYGATTGAEIGIYYAKSPSIQISGLRNGTLYSAVEDKDRIHMSFALRKNGNLIFTRSAFHWWLSGFKLGEYSNPDQLTMHIILELSNRNMAEAFVKGLKKVGYQKNEYTIIGKKVKVLFTKPHTTQPLARNKLTVAIMQKNNRTFCETYHKLTADYVDTLDKLEILRYQSPHLYKQILKMGKPEQVFARYYNIINKVKL